MADDELRNAIDAIVARLHGDVQAQLGRLEERHNEARDAVKRETEARAEEQWNARLDAARQEWEGKLTAAVADASADADKRLTAEVERVRTEAERSGAESLDRIRAELEQAAADAKRLQEEWQGRLQAGLADAAAESERRLTAETTRITSESERLAAEAQERLRGDLERAAVEAAERIRQEKDHANQQATATLREELEAAAARATAALREESRHEMDRALAAERERAGAELAIERQRATSELSVERDRSSGQLEAERAKVKTLSAALDEVRAELAKERETAQRAGDSQQKAREGEITDARVMERQAHVSQVEQLSAAVRSISGARSLSDTLSALVAAAATIAPRVALFVVNGRDLQGWRASGFETGTPAALRLPASDSELLSTAAATGTVVSTATAPAPAFASLPADRAGLAVPITVGGQSVAVLYADDATRAEPQAPAAWPEAVQLLGGHASACLAYITALRTTQAMRAAGTARSAPSGSEEDSSARRYARLLVSEIKLYNEAAVRMGREKRDLLARLQPEIERARRLYEERVSPTVGSRGAYFQQELVQTLADGDAALLGGTV